MRIKGVLLALAVIAPATLTALPPTAHAADGTLFRLPFLNGQQASYLLDDGRVLPLEFDDYSVGQPTPRLEVTFTSKGSTKK